ncbi:FtsX-like permease family protein [Oerskovia jenensis]|uniref:ABC transport system permease protein n=1 Tax=Oerskovia jenensis TaxID=162169 RepID=A0ABS2LIU9_9CELL|nr:FtsX-like permease family protein [Oerskovia jenensis]MBM7480346.1 putative ABC transport system permease protein [Oerskovia jenensis]
MRRSIGRLSAAGIAILIGTAFLTATLLAGNVMTQVTNGSIAARYADSDLVVANDQGLDAAEIAAVGTTPGVEAADARKLRAFQLVSGGKRTFQIVSPVMSDPRFEPQEVTTGAQPSAAGEIALPEDTADRLGLALGDTVTLVRSEWQPAAEGATAPGASDEPDAATDASADAAEAPADAGTTSPDEAPLGAYNDIDEKLTLVGLLDDPMGAHSQYGGAGLVDAAELTTWDEAAAEPGVTTDVTTDVLVALAPGTDVEAVRTQLADSQGNGTTVMTTDEYAKKVAAAMTGGEDVFTYMILTFAAIALLVAALVIANTFQVLVAQRTRTLALLRCVGADRKQLARSVLLEATMLGLIASVAGILVGTGLVQLALTVAGGMDLGVPLPELVRITVPVVLVPLLVGTVVTLVASFSPARAATRVAPLAALRPSDAPTVSTGAGLVRLVASILLVVGGASLLALGIVLGQQGSAEGGLLAATAGGAASFVGVLIGAIFWLPRVVSIVGKALTGSGSTAKLAAANTLRNPRRTAATSTALLIGVTLVAMMSTGAVSARMSMNNELDSRYPVDVSLATDGYDDNGGNEPIELPQTTMSTAESAEGIESVVPLTAATVTVDLDGQPITFLARGVDPADAVGLVRNAKAVDGLVPGTVVVPEMVAKDWKITTGDELSLVAKTPEGSGPAGTPATLEALVTPMGGRALLVTPDTLDGIAPGAPVTTAWVGLTDVTDAGSVVPALQDALAESSIPIDVTGAAVERALYQKVVDTVLGIVVGLLAVAVVIALIGVANTLSLSVIERRRESATLRAIGLSRSQLRWMLAIEGMLIAGVGAVLGIVLGVLYGWAGASAALAVMGDVTLAVPWRDVALVLVVALVAGLLASVIPGRSAARTSPVEALAVE